MKSKTQIVGYSVDLEFSLKKDNLYLLNLLYKKLEGGNISENPIKTSFYKSKGDKIAATLINYFDNHNLFGNKYIDYLKFRKVYIMKTQGKHLEKKGILKIRSISSKGSSETSTQEI
jgi:hypothetical protein